MDEIPQKGVFKPFRAARVASWGFRREMPRSGAVTAGLQPRFKCFAWGSVFSASQGERRPWGAPLFVTFSVAVVVPLFLGYFQPVGAAFSGSVRRYHYVENFLWW